MLSPPVAFSRKPRGVGGVSSVFVLAGPAVRRRGWWLPVTFLFAELFTCAACTHANREPPNTTYNITDHQTISEYTANKQTNAMYVMHMSNFIVRLAPEKRNVSRCQYWRLETFMALNLDCNICNINCINIPSAGIHTSVRQPCCAAVLKIE